MAQGCSLHRQGASPFSSGALQAPEFLLPQFRWARPLNAPRVPLSPPRDREPRRRISEGMIPPAAAATCRQQGNSEVPTASEMRTSQPVPVRKRNKQTARGRTTSSTGKHKFAVCSCPWVYAHSLTPDSVWRAAQPTVQPPTAAASLLPTVPAT